MRVRTDAKTALLSNAPRLRCLLIAVLGVLALAPAARAAAPGVNVSVLSPQSVSDVIASNSQYARFFLRWSDVEPTRGTFDASTIASYQDQFARLDAAGIKPVVVIVDAPSWANGSSDHLVPPTDAGEFGAFTGALAAKLRGKIAAY